MHDKNSPLNQQLVAFSEKIDHYIKNKNESLVELDYIENWLKNQSEKIRIQKLEKDYLAQYKKREKDIHHDGIVIFDSQFKIYHCSGPSNYFPTSVVNLTSTVYLLDFIDEADHDNFKKCFAKAKTSSSNLKLELTITTPDGLQSECVLTIDVKISNFSADRIVAFLNFEKNLDRQLAEYQSIMLDSLPGMDIYLFDKDYRYIMAGGKEKERFKLSNNYFIGKTLFEVMDKKTQRSLFPFYNKALNGEETEGEVRFQNDLYYLIAKPIKDNKGDTIAGVLIVQNVTKDKELERQLKKAKQDAQNANKAKSIFIANMSHEIRTPLSAIIGFTEQLEQTDLSKQQAQHLSLIKKASDHLLYLVTEIVFLFKLGMGKVYVEKIPFSLQELIDELYKICSIQATEKKLEFIVEKDVNLPDKLIGDPYRLRQILLNLLTNAIKYTDKGSIKFSCRLKNEYSKKVELIFTVSDTGKGICENDLPHIFNVFEQGNSRTENIRGGAGLGLGICKKLSELLKGSITVESKLNVGSSFSLSLPFKKAPSNQILESSKTFELLEEHLKNKKILLADDDEHNLLLGGMILKGWKTDYVLAKDGEEAITELRKCKFDLILLDINMPKKNGVQVIRTIRLDENCPNRKTPALSVTANALKSDIQKNLKAGFDDYLIKPFKELELYNKLCNVLSIEPSVKETSELPLKKELDLEADDLFNTKDLLQAAKEDNDFFTQMIDNFITNATKLAENFKQNIPVRNWKEIGEKSHKAIPSFRYFGLHKIASNFECIEDLALRDNNYKELPEITEHTLKLIS